MEAGWKSAHPLHTHTPCCLWLPTFIPPECQDDGIVGNTPSSQHCQLLLVPGDLLEFHPLSRYQRSIPLEKSTALECGFKPLPPLPKLHPQKASAVSQPRHDRQQQIQQQTLLVPFIL